MRPRVTQISCHEITFSIDGCHEAVVKLAATETGHLLCPNLLNRLSGVKAYHRNLPWRCQGPNRRLSTTTLGCQHQKPQPSDHHDRGPAKTTLEAPWDSQLTGPRGVAVLLSLPQSRHVQNVQNLRRFHKTVTLTSICFLGPSGRADVIGASSLETASI